MDGSDTAGNSEEGPSSICSIEVEKWTWFSSYSDSLNKSDPTLMEAIEEGDLRVYGEEGTDVMILPCFSE